MTHTPGPWSLSNRRQSGYRVETTKKRWSYDAKTICSCRPYPRTTDAYTEARANARLIAAAPDLLAVAKLAASPGRTMSDEEIREEFLDNAADLIIKARAAIAKATQED